MKKAFLFGLVLGVTIWVLEPTIISAVERVMDMVDDYRINASRTAHSQEEYREALRQLDELTIDDLFYWNNTIA